MKKDLIIPAMLPYTSDEETALAAKLQALPASELIQYIQSAENGDVPFAVERAHAMTAPPS